MLMNRKVRKQIEEAAYASPVAMVLMDWVRSTVGIDSSDFNWEGRLDDSFIYNKVEWLEF